MSITPFCQNDLLCHCWLGIATKLTKRCERGKGFLCKIRISDNHESPQSPHVSALVSLGNSYISMVEQFHQLDYGRFGVLTVQVTNLSAKVIMVCNHLRLSGTGRTLAADRRDQVQFCREIALGTLKIWGIASVFIGKVHSVPLR